MRNLKLIPVIDPDVSEKEAFIIASTVLSFDHRDQLIPEILAMNPKMIAEGTSIKHSLFGYGTICSFTNGDKRPLYLLAEDLLQLDFGNNPVNLAIKAYLTAIGPKVPIILYWQD